MRSDLGRSTEEAALVRARIEYEQQNAKLVEAENKSLELKLMMTYLETQMKALPSSPTSSQSSDTGKMTVSTVMTGVGLTALGAAACLNPVGAAAVAATAGLAAGGAGATVFGSMGFLKKLFG